MITHNERRGQCMPVAKCLNEGRMTREPLGRTYYRKRWEVPRLKTA